MNLMAMRDLSLVQVCRLAALASLARPLPAITALGLIAVLWLVHGETRVTDEATSSDGSASPAKLPGPFERDGIIQALLSRLFPKLP